MIRLIPAALAAMLALAAPPAMAQGADDSVAARQAGFKQMGKATRDLARALRSSSPDLDMVRTSAAILRRNAHALPRWFPNGSGPATGRKTDAMAAIWTDQKGFRAAALRFSAAADAMAAAGRGMDVAAMRVRMKAMGDACAACHRIYRQED